jgi:multicomponent Na+:H+ antiporter subunit B
MNGMTVIVKTVSSWVKLLIFLFGIYIIIYGHLTPGGGFAGGVILASSYILVMLAFGRTFTEENLSLGWASKLDCVGALMFAALALWGLFYGGGHFFWNFIHHKQLSGGDNVLKLVSAGTIPLANIAIGLKVMTSLFLVTLVLSTFRLDRTVAEEKE